MKVTFVEPAYWPRGRVWSRCLAADKVVWLDDVVPRRDPNGWNDRTLLVTSDGKPWEMRVPMKYFRPAGQRWSEIEFGDRDWQVKHPKSIARCYRYDTPHWEAVQELIDVYQWDRWRLMNDFMWAAFLLTGVQLRAGVPCRSSALRSRGDEDGTEHRIALCKILEADTVVMPPHPLQMVVSRRFERAGIKVEMIDPKPVLSGVGEVADPSVLDVIAWHGRMEAMQLLNPVSEGSPEVD